jgi:exodeoxyribonuclease-3
VILATWNVNSVKSRLPLVLEWIAAKSPDVLALQEIKCRDEEFPRSEFEAAGYSCFVQGQKTYNGVALLVRKPLELEDARRGLGELGEDPQARMVSGRVAGVRVVNVYVPNGQKIGTEAFEYKLRWLGALGTHLRNAAAGGEPTLVMGDFNIAPEPRDIHDPRRYEQSILFTPAEREALQQLLDLGFTDVFRRFHEEAGLYSWWDYRLWVFSQRLGARIDLILGNPAAGERAAGCWIDPEPRHREKPSDHTPVVIELGP